jgi:M6 family metalloprotease-like protein
MSNALRVILAVAILLGGQWLAEQPDIYEPIFDAIRDEVIVNDDPIIVPMQAEERWLVLLIEFPDDGSGPGEDVARAEALLSGTNSAKTYFAEISGGQSTLFADVQSTIHMARYDSTAYGQDDGDKRDAGTADTGGPAGLVAEAMESTFEELDISIYDLDGDGWVDRLLVLHTGGAQEDDGGPDAIWSHYAPINQGIKVGDVYIGSYTMASFDSGLGTVIHEMFHMFGAVDLYDVHSDAPSNEWSGVGDWDIMASGNWNGNGRTPALPTSATLELIGAIEPLDISIGTSGAENQSYVLVPHVSPWGTVRIEIAPGEHIWMETRVNSGFDRDLPGHGVLVSQQDRNRGDLSNNEVNHDPDIAYLKIVEADGDGGLTLGDDEGAAGDVFTSGSFGASGIEIRDGRGRLVPWTVTVSDVDNLGANITISSPGRGHAEVLPPLSPVRLLGNERLPVQYTAYEDCLPWAQVTSTDGRIVSLVDAHQIAAGESASFDLVWSEGASPGTSGLIEGTLGCGINNPATDVEIAWRLVLNRLIPTHHEDIIPVNGQSAVAFELDFDGQGLSAYDVVIEGPLSRIATTELSQALGDGSILTIQVNPAGLLSPGMLAKGKIQLYDEDGLAGEIEITLQAQPPGDVGGWLMWLAEPANNIKVVSILLALWAISGVSRKKSGPPKDEMVVRRPTGRLRGAVETLPGAAQYDDYDPPLV